MSCLLWPFHKVSQGDLQSHLHINRSLAPSRWDKLLNPSGQLMLCSFQVVSCWTKPKVDSTGPLIWCIVLCAEVIAIDHCRHGPVDSESSSKGWVYLALIYPCLSFQRGSRYLTRWCKSKYINMKETASSPHIVVGGLADAHIFKKK